MESSVDQRQAQFFGTRIKKLDLTKNFDPGFLRGYFDEKDDTRLVKMIRDLGYDIQEDEGAPGRYKITSVSNTEASEKVKRENNLDRIVNFFSEKPGIAYSATEISDILKMPYNHVIEYVHHLRGLGKIVDTDTPEGKSDKSRYYIFDHK